MAERIKSVASYLFQTEEGIELYESLIEGIDAYPFLQQLLLHPELLAGDDELLEIDTELDEKINQLSNAPRKTLRLAKQLREQMEADVEVVKDEFLNNEDEDFIAEVVTALRKIDIFKSGVTQPATGTPTPTATSSPSSTTDRALLNTLQQIQESQETMNATMSQINTQGENVAGGMVHDPSVLSRQDAIRRSIYEQMAGIDPELYTWEERVILVKEAAIWFFSDNETKAYAYKLLEEAGKTFEVPQLVGQLIEERAIDKAVNFRNQVLNSKNAGNAEEIAGLQGAVDGDPLSLEALVHTLGVDLRIILKDGSERVIPYNVAELLDWMRGDAYKPEQLASMESEYLIEVFEKYNDLFIARYGEDFDALEVYEKYERINKYRTDLSLRDRQRLNPETGLWEALEHRNERYTQAEQRFVDEVLNQAVWISEVETYTASHANVSQTINAGEPILLNFITTEEEQKKLNDDITALPLFPEYLDPYAPDAEIPIRKLYTKPWDAYKRDGIGDFVHYLLAAHDIDPNQIEEVGLPRNKFGQPRQFVFMRQGRGGRQRYGSPLVEKGLLSSGGVARLGVNRYDVLYEVEVDADGQPLRDLEGNYIYVTEKDEHGHVILEPKLNLDGTQRYRNGSLVLEPKYKPLLDEDGNPQMMTPVENMIANIASSRLSIIPQTVDSIWYQTTMYRMIDPGNRGDILPKGLFKAGNFKQYMDSYQVIPPYAIEFLGSRFSDLLYRKSKRYALLQALDPKAAKDRVLRHLDPYNLKEKNPPKLKPYQFASETSQTQRLRNQLNNLIATDQDLSPAQVNLAERMVEHGRWYRKPDGTYISAANFQKLMIKDMVTAQSSKPLEMIGVHSGTNHVYWTSVRAWYKTAENYLNIADTDLETLPGPERSIRRQSRQMWINAKRAVEEITIERPENQPELAQEDLTVADGQNNSENRGNPTWFERANQWIDRTITQGSQSAYQEAVPAMTNQEMLAAEDQSLIFQQMIKRLELEKQAQENFLEQVDQVVQQQMVREGFDVAMLTTDNQSYLELRRQEVSKVFKEYEQRMNQYVGPIFDTAEDIAWRVSNQYRAYRLNNSSHQSAAGRLRTRFEALHMVKGLAPDQAKAMRSFDAESMLDSVTTTTGLPSFAKKGRLGLFHVMGQTSTRLFDFAGGSGSRNMPKDHLGYQSKDAGLLQSIKMPLISTGTIQAKSGQLYRQFGVSPDLPKDFQDALYRARQAWLERYDMSTEIAAEYIRDIVKPLRESSTIQSWLSDAQNREEVVNDMLYLLNYILPSRGQFFYKLADEQGAPVPLAVHGQANEPQVVAGHTGYSRQPLDVSLNTPQSRFSSAQAFESAIETTGMGEVVRTAKGQAYAVTRAMDTVVQTWLAVDEDYQRVLPETLYINPLAAYGSRSLHVVGDYAEISQESNKRLAELLIRELLDQGSATVAEQKLVEDRMS